MALLGTCTHNMYPSDPTREVCPPSSKIEFIEFQSGKVQISTFEDARYDTRGRDIVAVIGPIACYGCDSHCDQAYVGLTDSLQVVEMELLGVEAADTPVYIRQLKSFR